MNWEAIGAIGEIVGALAVFVTLAYLAVQIRQNTRAARASALDSSVSAVNSIRQQVFGDPEVADLYIRGLKDPQSLSERDQVRFRFMLHNIFWSLWNLYSQAKLTNLSSSAWESQSFVIKRLFTSPGTRLFWENHGHEFEEPFRKEVERIRAS